MPWGSPLFWIPALLAAGAAAFAAYDRLVCRPRCWKHGHRPDFAAIPPETWEAYFHALPNVLETLHRSGLDSPFPDTLCAWKLDRFEGRLADLARDELRAARLHPRDFRRCHRFLTYLVRFAFPHGLHHSFCVTRLRQALDEDRVEVPRRARAREMLLEHERQMGVLAEMERRFGPPLPREAAEYSYGLMLRWQAVFEEHGYTLNPDLDSWRRERGELGI